MLKPSLMLLSLMLKQKPNSSFNMYKVNRYLKNNVKLSKRNSKYYLLKHNRKSSIMLSVTADKPTPICIKSIEATKMDLCFRKALRSTL